MYLEHSNQNHFDLTWSFVFLVRIRPTVTQVKEKHMLHQQVKSIWLIYFCSFFFLLFLKCLIIFRVFGNNLKSQYFMISSSFRSMSVGDRHCKQIEQCVPFEKWTSARTNIYGLIVDKWVQRVSYVHIKRNSMQTAKRKKGGKISDNFSTSQYVESMCKVWARWWKCT